MTPSWRRRARCRVRVGDEHWATSGTRSARRMPLMLKLGRCRAASRVCSARLKKLRPLTVRPLTARGWVRRSSARMPAEKSSRLERYSEGRHVFGFDGQDGLPGKLFIERFEDGSRAEHQIGGVLEVAAIASEQDVTEV